MKLWTGGKLVKKIVFVINYFYPDLASTGQLMTELCKELQNEFEVTVIATQPGYAGERKETSKKIIEISWIENIRIIRLKIPNVDKTSKLSRAKYIFSYFVLANYVLLREKNVDLIYTISQPPVLGGLIGSIGKLIKRTKHIYNIQDFNPEQAEAVGFTSRKILFKIARAIDKFNCSIADHIVLVGHDMAETLQKRYADRKKPNHTVINNWTNEEEIVPLDKHHPKVNAFIRKEKLEDKFIVMYSGNLGLYYDLENIIKLAKEFQHYSDLVFLFIGEGAKKKEMEDYVKKEKLSNVRFLPYQPLELIKYSLNVADIHLVVNQKGIKGVSVPSKIYGVLAAGKPILGVLEEGSEAQILIEKSKAGIVVEPLNYQGISEAIKTFYYLDENKKKLMGLNGRSYLDSNLKKSISINKYRELLKQLTN
jgi:glycosyltransferase involved in cell wall biosynthesis